MKTLFALVAIALACAAASRAAEQAVPAGFDPFHETKAEYDARAQWLRDAKVGVFIHWNPSSLIAKEISWSREAYGKEKYDQLYKRFKGEQFNADQWVKLFYDSGIRYAVVVPKHHDGFSMFDTKTSDYKVTHSPFGRDYVKEISAACHRGGVTFCLYYSVLDWWNPKYRGNAGADLTAYIHDVFKPHMMELLTHYGEVGYIWFDGCWEDSWTHADGREMYAFIRRLQPGTLIGNRIEPRPFTDAVDTFYPGADGVGDFQARERSVGDYYADKAWDHCYQLAPATGEGWSWRGSEMIIRSRDTILGHLIQCIGRDGGMLLGVGPRPDGTIEPAQAAAMLEMGNWLKLNGEAVYGTRGGPWLPGVRGVSTRKGDKVFVFVTRWTRDLVTLPALLAKVKSARLVTRGTVSFEDGGDKWTLRVPEQFHRPAATIVELTLDRDAMKLPVVEVLGPKNLALNKPVKVSSFWPGRERELNPRHVTDGKPGTIWAAKEKDRTAWVTVDLERECEVSEAMLSDEPYARTQAFELEAEVGGQWKKLAAGAGIGDELNLEFSPVKARRFRLKIRKASDTPTLAEFQLFGGSR